MPQCRSIKEVNDYINVFVLRAIQEIADDIREEVYKDVRDEYNFSMRSIHSRGTSENSKYFQYEHTFDVLESICQPQAKLVNGKIEVEIYYDPDKIKPFYNKNNYWNSHMNITGGTTWKGVSIPELLPIWLELGTDYGLAPREGWEIMGKWHRQVKSTLKRRIKAILKSKYGLKVK